MNNDKATDIHDVKPSSLSHLIGNDHVRQQVQVALDSCFEDQIRFPDTLLSGPPGLRKSALANVISKELAVELHETLGQAISGPAEMNVLLLSAKDNELIHIDEVHLLPTEQQTTLFFALDHRRLIVQSGNGQTSIPLAKFSFLLSTTDPHRVLPPLRDRMRMTLELNYLSEMELIEVVRQRSRALGWTLEDAALPEIACRGRGVPRISLRILQSSRRVARSEGEEVVTLAHVQRACQLDRIDDRGLSSQEQKYLQLLGTGSLRLNVLASILGMAPRTVSEVIEPFLVRSRLLIKDKNGLRQLTQQGLDHLSKSRQQDV